jgi:hypothetical protein
MKETGTIVVMELAEGSPTGFKSFVYFDKESKSIAAEKAEANFTEKIKENGGSDDDLDAYLDEGIFEKCTYSVVLTWATETEIIGSPENI